MQTTNQSNATALRTIFRTMDPHQAQEIREAYYKAMEGLQTLAEQLEIADAQQKQPRGILLDEHFNAINALEAFQSSRLGTVL